MKSFRSVFFELRMLLIFVFKRDISIEKSLKIGCLLKLKPKYFQETWIYFANEQPKSIHKKFQYFKVGTAAISSISYGDLNYGVQKNLQPKKITKNYRLSLSPFPHYHWLIWHPLTMVKLELSLRRKAKPSAIMIYEFSLMQSHYTYPLSLAT